MIHTNVWLPWIGAKKKLNNQSLTNIKNSRSEHSDRLFFHTSRDIYLYEFRISPIRSYFRELKGVRSQYFYQTSHVGAYRIRPEDIHVD